VEVENFSQQVVQGILYKFDLVLQQDASCSSDIQRSKCKLVVWDKPWESYREVQWDQVECDDDDSIEKPPVPGSLTQVKNLTSKHQEIVDFALSQLGSRPDAADECQDNFVAVENFSQQVVQGTLYKFDLILKKDASCSTSNDNHKCKMVVWDKPWENYREVQWEQVDCEGNEDSEPLLYGVQAQEEEIAVIDAAKAKDESDIVFPEDD